MMNDPLIIAGALLISLALVFTLLGRKKPRQRARSVAPQRTPSVPSLPRADCDDDDMTLVMSSAELAALPKSPGAEIPSILAEALAEAQEATSAIQALERAKSKSLRVIYEPGAERDEPTGPIPLFDISFHGDTDRGLLRKQNEDALLLLSERGLLAVADGMGGHSGGQVASALAIDALRESFEEGAEPAAELGEGPRRALQVATAMQRANEVVFRTAKSRPELRDMGTTLIALRYLPKKQRIYVGHVGDSRCYRLRHGELRQLTTDHALKEVGLAGPRGNDLFKAIGIEPGVSVDVIVDVPLPGDTYLLCSDGLTKMVTHERIRDVLSQEADEEALVYGLIEQALDAGGRDNITVVVAKVGLPSERTGDLAGAA